MPLAPIPHANFEDLVREHQAAVFRTLLRLTGSREHIEDLAQEVFLRLFRALPAFRGDALLSTYLYRITLNVAQDEWKRRRRLDRPLVSLSAPVSASEDSTQLWEDRLADTTPTADQQLSTHELQLALEEELLALSNVERTALVLYHQEERTYIEIAAILNLSIGTVRTHLHRARKKLHDRMEARLAARTPRKDSAPCPNR